MKRIVEIGFLIFISIGLFGINASAQNKTRKLDEFFSALAKNQDFNGSILVAEKGKIVYEKSFGYADFPGRKLNTTKTIFPIASISKTITAIAILQQVEKGKLQLNDPAVKYLPDFPYPEITIRHLLSHTSGIPPYNAFFKTVRELHPNRVFTNADFISGLAANKKPLIYQPGESWNYDNTNFIVLALILEKVSGETYRAYIGKHILKPAGMNQTSFFPYTFDSSRNKIKDLAIPHWYPQIYADEPVRADSISYISQYWRAYLFSGFGDFVSTTRDLLRYDQALYNGALVTEKVLNEAFIPVKLNNGKENPGNYGLGWTIAKDESLGKVGYHVGGSIGLSCILYRNVTKHQTVIAFDIAHPFAYYLAISAQKILTGQQVALPKKKLARIYGKLLVTKGKDVAAGELEKLNRDTANYELDKEELIKLGYEFLGDINPFHIVVEPRYDEALEVFKQCTRLFPDYWNCYDSYGDAFARTGAKDLAIKMYRRSLELKPDSESGKKALQKLLKEEPNR